MTMIIWCRRRWHSFTSNIEDTVAGDWLISIIRMAFWARLRDAARRRIDDTQAAVAYFRKVIYRHCRLLSASSFRALTTDIGRPRNRMPKSRRFGLIRFSVPALGGTRLARLAGQRRAARGHHIVAVWLSPPRALSIYTVDEACREMRRPYSARAGRSSSGHRRSKTRLALHIG